MMNQEQLATEESAAQAEQALKKLASRKAEERTQAELTLERLGPEAADILLRRLEEESQKRRKRTRCLRWGLGIYLSIVGLGLVFWMGNGILTGHWGRFPWELLRVFSFMGSIFGVTAATAFQKNATGILAKFDDPRFVGQLADALDYNDKNTHAIAKTALTNLLPRLRASDTDLLDDDQRKRLHRSAGMKKKDTAFTLAVLKGLEQVGDDRDLEFVRKLATDQPVTSSEKQIHEEAESCLPFVEQRAELHRAAQTLLRAAETPGNPADTLLRPAQGVSETEATNLLRPAAPDHIPQNS